MREVLRPRIRRARRNRRRGTTQQNNPILDILFSATDFRRFLETLEGGKGPVAAFGLPEAHKAHITAAAAGRSTVLLVAATDTGASRLHADIRAFGIDCMLFLPRETPLVHVCAVSGERREARIHALTKLLTGRQAVIVASVAAVMQQLAPPEVFLSQIRSVHPGDTAEPRKLMAELVTAGYDRVELVEGRGQAAMRGDILDVFPPQAALPVRIEFFGDEIDQLRSFDPVTQRAIEQQAGALLPPAYETPQTAVAMRRALSRIAGKPEFFEQEQAWSQMQPCAGADALLPALYPHLSSVLEYLPKDALILLDETHRLEEAARTAEITFAEQVQAMLERGEGLSEQGRLMIPAGEALARLNTPRTGLLYTLSRAHPLFPPREVAQFLSRPAPQYVGGTDELIRDIALWKKSREAVVIYAGAERERLCRTLFDAGTEIAAADALTRAPVPGEVLAVSERLGHGFAYPELHLTVLTESELFGRSDRPLPRQKKKAGLTFSELEPGDFVVHEAHGIGRFAGVKTLTAAGATRDYLLLEYRGGDQLYIPTDQLSRVQKYIGGGEGDFTPSLSKLGGTDWAGRVSRAKASAKKLAVDLAELYAARAMKKGHAFSKDTVWQRQFEERFPYEETPDQKQSILEIKQDMEKERPMDRLLCGDVGYGKTEVALRAAFKAMQDGKQVALLVPTTILAQQHYNTAAARFADFPVRTACLSRFRTAQEKQAIIKGLADGTVDLVIGTHALLAKSVKFKDLGLLIVDEEHRFGVNHKEQIQSIKQTVDVLTLTATPIPRTLNMSMTGVRDISVIETPPEERHPVQTFVLEYTDALLVDAISREIARGGQAYIVYNRVQFMESFARRLAELLPEARVLMGHGQMPEAQLEQTMLDFYEGRADVLLCSTIIESGLDIPNANTLIVLEADHFGLAQLYQLRGRVGRSTRLGYAYFTIRRSAAINETAHKRLMAIREFTQFGAGFQIATRDLEIRGAGSLLGAEQHGMISDIGYEYYCKIVKGAVAEAKGDRETPLGDARIDIAFDTHIPKTYIKSEVQRLSAYRRIADVDSGEALIDMRDELTDRYGEPPEAVENLMLSALIKSYADRAMLERVSVSDGEAMLTFSETASVDGGRLILAVTGTVGAKLVATDPPGVRIIQKNRTAAQIAGLLPQLLTVIAACAGANAQQAADS